MHRLLWTLLITLLLAGGLRAAEAPQGLGFVSIAFHDVVDDPAELDGDAITTDHLVDFFEWMRAEGWTAISLDDVAAAHAGRRPLPPKAMLVTFDDGYRSLYTRVWPLARAYKVPIVAALVGSWMSVAPGGIVEYGDQRVAREYFISWDEAREMQRSGIVEFASHSHDLHRGVLGNPQGNLLPAAVTARFDPVGGYETEAATLARLRADLLRSRDQLERELDRAPRAMVWPFGRYNLLAQRAATEAGFSFELTLDPEPASAARPLAIARFLPTDNPRVGELAAALRFADPLPAAQRLVCVDPATLWSPDPAEADARLGSAIERLRTLGATAVVLDAVQRRADGSLEAWFPSATLPLAGDWLSRVAWQMQTRAGVASFVRLPPVDALPTLAAELERHVPASGLLLDDPGLAALPPAPGGGAPWLVRERRQAIDPATLPAGSARSWQAFERAAQHRPGLRLALLAPAAEATAADWQPNPIADLTLRRSPAAGTDALPLAARRRAGLWIESESVAEPAALAGTLRRLQQRGGTIFGWCPDEALADRPSARQLAPDASASTFPVKF